MSDAMTDGALSGGEGTIDEESPLRKARGHFERCWDELREADRALRKDTRCLRLARKYANGEAADGVRRADYALKMAECEERHAMERYLAILDIADRARKTRDERIAESERIRILVDNDVDLVEAAKKIAEQRAARANIARRVSAARTALNAIHDDLDAAAGGHVAPEMAQHAS